jgi:hypothetical protein
MRAAMARTGGEEAPAVRRGTAGPLIAAVVLACIAPAARPAASRPTVPSAAGDADPLAEDIDRWSALVRSDESADEFWAQVRNDSRPLLAEAEAALRGGRRLLALQRLAVVRPALAAAAWTKGLPAGSRDEGALETEWKRMAAVVTGASASGGGGPAGLRPAAARALGEAAIAQARVYHEASLQYGRNTDPRNGFFYLGAARAQREFVDFLRALPAAELRAAAPRLRPMGVDLDALQADLLALYRPPLSIDRHGEFIAVSAAVKEARELDAAGLRHGALLRLLQAALRLAPLRARPRGAPDAGSLRTRLRGLEARLAEDGVDHSIGRIFLESAEWHLEAAAAAAGGAAAHGSGGAPGDAGGPAGLDTAAAIADDVLPRYFAALRPAPPAAVPKAAPRATVTLVRWPYT